MAACSKLVCLQPMSSANPSYLQTSRQTPVLALANRLTVRPP